MPGAVELAHFDKDLERTLEGPSMAFDSYLYGSSASVEEVLRFYENELARSGWTRNNFMVNRSTTDLRVAGWCKQRIAFRVAIKLRDEQILAHPERARHATIFDAGLIGFDPAQETCGPPPSRT